MGWLRRWVRWDGGFGCIGWGVVRGTVYAFARPKSVYTVNLRGDLHENNASCTNKYHIHPEP